jgi:hypothetical protein
MMMQIGLAIRLESSKFSRYPDVPCIPRIQPAGDFAAAVVTAPLAVTKQRALCVASRSIRGRFNSISRNCAVSISPVPRWCGG